MARVMSLGGVRKYTRPLIGLPLASKLPRRWARKLPGILEAAMWAKKYRSAKRAEARITGIFET